MPSLAQIPFKLTELTTNRISVRLMLFDYLNFVAYGLLRLCHLFLLFKHIHTANEAINLILLGEVMFLILADNLGTHLNLTIPNRF